MKFATSWFVNVEFTNVLKLNYEQNCAQLHYITSLCKVHVNMNVITESSDIILK